MSSSPPQLFEPSPLTQKLKPSNWFQSTVGFTQAVKSCGLVDSTRVNLQALPNRPSTSSTVPAGIFLLSLAVTSPGLCNTRLKSHSSGCGVWPAAVAAEVRTIAMNVQKRVISSLLVKNVRYSGSGFKQ